MSVALANRLILTAMLAIIAAAPASVHADAREDYDTTCSACHNLGVTGAPVLGDDEAWEPRLAQGIDTLYKHSIDGFTGDTGIMPPKGGFSNMSERRIRAIVDFMVKQVE